MQPSQLRAKGVGSRKDSTQVMEFANVEVRVGVNFIGAASNRSGTEVRGSAVYGGGGNKLALKCLLALSTVRYL